MYVDVQSGHADRTFAAAAIIFDVKRSLSALAYIRIVALTLVFLSSAASLARSSCPCSSERTLNESRSQS
jgi:hypothetical protein